MISPGLGNVVIILHPFLKGNEQNDHLPAAAFGRDDLCQPAFDGDCRNKGRAPCISIGDFVSSGTRCFAVIDINDLTVAAVGFILSGSQALPVLRPAHAERM